MLQKYEIANEKDEINSMKEIIQEIVLSGLARSDFFEKAAFYGGTALRIFYGLNRYSEDLDFALLEKNTDFQLEPYFEFIEEEIKAYGLKLKVFTKQKKVTNIKSAFVKGNTLEHIVLFFSENNHLTNDKILKDIKITFVVDVNPPSGATYELKYQFLPTPYLARLYDTPSLFAGKIHAILCRGWNNRIKGRDLYDYIFFLSQDTAVNMELLKNKLLASNYISENQEFTIPKLRELLNEKFYGIDYEVAKQDVVPFLKGTSSLDIWSYDFFGTITQKLR